MAWIQPLFLTFQLVVFALILAGTLGVAGGWAAAKLRAAGGFWSLIAAVRWGMLVHVQPVVFQGPHRQIVVRANDSDCYNV